MPAVCPARGSGEAPLPAHPAARPGTRGTRRLQPGPPPRRPEHPAAGPVQEEGARLGARSPVSSPGTHGAGRAGPGQPRRGPLPRGAKHATPRSSAAQRPSPSRAGTPSPRRRAGAPLPGRGARLSPGARACELVPPPASPHARQRAAFKSPGYSAGGESMRAGAARRGRGEAGRRWGCWEGVWRGGAGTQGKKAGGLQAVFVAATATGSLRVAPRLPYHYLGQCAAPSPPKHLGESCPAPRGASPPLSQSATITPTRYSGHPPVPGPSSTPPIQDQP